MSLLFEPFSLGSLQIKNRFVRSATQDYLGNADGTVSSRQKALYEALAAGGSGLIISGHAYVQHPLGKASINQNGIYEDKFIGGFRELAAITHQGGAAFILQVSHAGRQVSPDWRNEQTPIAPSAVTDGSIGITPREMTEAEIWDVIDAFAAAMGRAKAAGCDGVQIHIAHGYFLSQFLSPYTNRRLDDWGGSIDNRIRIIREIVSRGRRVAGDAFPIIAKLNSTDGFSGEGYLALDDVVYAARQLEKWSIDAIEVSGGVREAKGTMSKPAIKKAADEAYFATAAKAVKAAVKIPVILVGGLRSMEIMTQIVRDGTADMVALSRPLIKEPDLINKFKTGQEKASCVSCNACFNPEGIKCALLK